MNIDLDMYQMTAVAVVVYYVGLRLNAGSIFLTSTVSRLRLSAASVFAAESGHDDRRLLAFDVG